MKRNVAAVVFSSLLIFLFTYTSIDKLSGHKQFVNVLHDVPLLKAGAEVVAWTVPLTELTIVLLLFFPKTRLAGFYSSVLLLSLFTVYLVYMIVYLPKLPCSCGGVISRMSWRQHVWFNVAWVGAALVGVTMERRVRISAECGCEVRGET